jgi:hypothetical protein
MVEPYGFSSIIIRPKRKSLHDKRESFFFGAGYGMMFGQK